MEHLTSFIFIFNYFVLSYYAFANFVYFGLLAIAVWVIFTYLIRLRYGRYKLIHPSVAPPVSVIISAYNEEPNIVGNVESLLSLNYPEYEVIVVNDGSLDRTLHELIKRFDLKKKHIVYRSIIPTSKVKGFWLNPEYPNLVVVDKEHAGKADSLNIGINISRAPYFCSVDADSIMEPDAIARLMRPIIESPNLVRATGGIVRLVNGCEIKKGRIAKVGLPKDHLSRFQIVEYIRSFLFGRAGLSALNSLLIISGTFSMFHKKSVQDAGGYKFNTVTEDMELVVRLHKHFRDKKQRYNITFVPDPICWTEAPRSLSNLARQRRRWHIGLAESLFVYRSMIFNPRYGRIGLFALPYHLLVELLGPVIEVVGFFVMIISYWLGIINYEFFLLFLAMALLIGVFFSTGAILLEEMTYRRYPNTADLLKLVLYGVFENFGYRQINAFWRAWALGKFIVSRKKKWEYVKKVGFEGPAQKPAL